MGGGKDQTNANKQIKSQTEYQTGQQAKFDTRNTADLDASRARGDELYSSLKAGYSSMANANPLTGADVGGGGGGGGYQMPAWDPRFQKVEDKYQNFMDTGGWDPQAKTDQQGRINSLTEFGKTGGIDDAAQARMRGGGGYEEFAKTGGFSDKDISNIRTRGTSGIPAMYGRVRDEANRGAAIAGGNGPGRAVLAGRMARQQAGGMADASLNAELGIKQQVNAGRQYGIGGMSTSETNLQDLLTRNKMGGLTGASDVTQNMQESLMGGQKWGTEGYKGIVGEQQNRADQQAQINAASAANSASASSANDRWAQEFNARQKAAGLEGLGSLYGGPGSGEYNVNKDFALQSAGTYGNQVQGGGVNLKTGNVNPWDNVAKIAGSVAGGMTGLGAIGSAVGGAAKGATALNQVGQVYRP